MVPPTGVDPPAACASEGSPAASSSAATIVVNVRGNGMVIEISSALEEAYLPKNHRENTLPAPLAQPTCDE
jgi:hypothetical protein